MNDVAAEALDMFRVFEVYHIVGLSLARDLCDFLVYHRIGCRLNSHVGGAPIRHRLLYQSIGWIALILHRLTSASSTLGWVKPVSSLVLSERVLASIVVEILISGRGCSRVISYGVLATSLRRVICPIFTSSVSNAIHLLKCGDLRLDCRLLNPPIVRLFWWNARVSHRWAIIEALRAICGAILNICLPFSLTGGTLLSGRGVAMPQ